MAIDRLQFDDHIVGAGGLNGLFVGGGAIGRANTGFQKPALQPATAQ